MCNADLISKEKKTVIQNETTNLLLQVLSYLNYHQYSLFRNNKINPILKIHELSLYEHFKVNSKKDWETNLDLGYDSGLREVIGNRCKSQSFPIEGNLVANLK